VAQSCDQLHAAIRRVNTQIPSFEELHLPPVYRKIADEIHEGLVIVCGVTGCGKSTTLAAMIDHINEESADNIISIEDPIEYVFKPKKSIISQREIGLDVDVFSDALRSAVRQDPDLLFIGEMRDRECWRRCRRPRRATRCSARCTPRTRCSRWRASSSSSRWTSTSLSAARWPTA
jgi:Tfp pilus assembly pilus retraction ATPase PilT